MIVQILFIRVIGEISVFPYPVACLFLYFGFIIMSGVVYERRDCL